MNKLGNRDLQREDIVKAMQEIDTYLDVSIEDIIDINKRAEKFARMRKTEDILAGTIMSQPVQTVTTGCTLADAAHLMVTKKISGIPVVDEKNQLIGIVTEADLLLAVGVPIHHPTHSVWQTLESLFSHNLELKEPNGNVAEIMVTHVVTVAPEDTLHDVLELMKKNRIKRVIVTDNENHVVGMITRSDLVRIFFQRIQLSTINHVRQR